jgi:hypothetical protein
MLELETIKYKIEKLAKPHHIEILKILKKSNDITLNENKSGVYVNLSFLSQPIIDEITAYIHYVEEQEATLNSLEIQKLEFQNTFFTEKGNKEEVISMYK